MTDMYRASTRAWNVSVNLASVPLAGGLPCEALEIDCLEPNSQQRGAVAEYIAKVSCSVQQPQPYRDRLL